jgi:predicted aspartyl protease
MARNNNEPVSQSDGLSPVILKVRNYGDMQKAAEGLIPATAVRAIEIEAIVDTRATYVCLPRSDIEKLGLSFHRDIDIWTASGRVSRRLFSGAWVGLMERDTVMEIVENDEGTPPLVGSLLLDALDLVVDPGSQQVTTNPAHNGEWVLDCFCLSR